MAFRINFAAYSAGKTLYAYIKKLTNGAPGQMWDDVNLQFSSAVVSPNEQISLTAGAGVEKTFYSGETSGNLGTYSGKVIVYVVDTEDNYVVGTNVVEVFHGVEVDESVYKDRTIVALGAEKNTAQSVPVMVFNPATGAPSSASVTSTQIGPPIAGLPYGNTTNAAIYTGAPGAYLVQLTASETNVADGVKIRVKTSDGGQGDLLLMVGDRSVEADLKDGGRLDTIFDTIDANLDTVKDTDLPAIDTKIDALPTAAQAADAVWDEAISGHVAAGSAGNLVERLDIVAAGGAGELTAAGASNLPNLDAAVSTRATPAQVNTEVDTALTDIHLDHLFAATYDASAKPGVADALLNEMVEDDGGITRYTVNALENGPGGTISASLVADAVWDELQSAHTTVGSFGEIASEIANILADTNELQTDLADGGRVDNLIDAVATQASVDALNDLSTADVDARLQAIGLDHLVSSSVAGGDVTTNSIFGKLASATGVWSTFDASTDSMEALRDRGDAAWTTGAGGSAPTAADIRAEIDSNSTQLAAIVADTNELQADWADGGRLDVILDAKSTHTAADVRTEMDSNSTQLAAIVADSNELQADWTDGGRLDLILDEIKTDGDAVLVDTDAIDVTLKSGGTIHTLITNIDPAPSTISAEFINPSRTFRFLQDQSKARNIVTARVGDNITLAGDFTDVLNPDTSIASAGGVTVTEGDGGDLTIGTAAPSQDREKVNVQISGWKAGKTYVLKFECNTTDGDTISGEGVVKVK